MSCGTSTAILLQSSVPWGAACADVRGPGLSGKGEALTLPWQLVKLGMQLVQNIGVDLNVV